MTEEVIMADCALTAEVPSKKEQKTFGTVASKELGLM